MLKRTSLLALLAPLVSGAAFAADPPKQDGQWRGSLGAGLSITQSTTDSVSVNLTGDAVRATAADQWDLAGAVLYGSSKDAEGVKTTSANLARAGARYAYNLDPKAFGYGSLNLNYDQLQNIDLRAVAVLGLGYHVVKTDDTVFDVFGGLAYNHTQYVDSTVNATELQLGEESSHKLATGTSLTQRLAVYPNLSDSGQYRLQFAAGLVTKISDSLNLTVTLADNYQSNPPPGTSRNELLFITGVSISFGK
jgi:putative salt-induced outer membrane protein